MPIKIKKSQRKLIALTLAERAKPFYLRFVNKFIKDEVISTITSGRSPVNKGGIDPRGTSGRLRYEQYSESYKDGMGKGRLSGKKQRPVNLELTGKMLRSIKSRKARNYVRVWFSDSKAKYHDKLGAGKKQVIRRMVPNPKKGEKFNAGISRRLVNALKNAIKQAKR